MKKLFALLALTSLLTGCLVVPEVPSPRIVVTDDAPKGKFCPPGQARKGRC